MLIKELKSSRLVFKAKNSDEKTVSIAFSNVDEAATAEQVDALKTIVSPLASNPIEDSEASFTYTFK